MKIPAFLSSAIRESSSHVFIPSPLDSENSQWRWTFLRCIDKRRERDKGEKKKEKREEKIEIDREERERGRGVSSTFPRSFLSSFHHHPFHVNPTSIFRSKVFRAAEKSAAGRRILQAPSKSRCVTREKIISMRRRRRPSLALSGGIKKKKRKRLACFREFYHVGLPRRRSRLEERERGEEWRFIYLFIYFGTWNFQCD